MSSILYFFLKLISFVPFSVLYLLSDLLIGINNRFIKYRHDVVKSNLREAFPEKSDKEIDRLAKRFFKQLADTMLFSLKMFSISERQVRKRVQVPDIDVMRKHLDSGRNVVMMCPHYSNWEAFVLMALYFEDDMNCHAIYQRLSNKFMDQKVRKSRSRFGAQMVATKDCARTFLNSPNNGKHIFGMVADQSPFISKIRYWVNFLNQDTPVHVGTESLARQTGCAIVFCYPRPIKRGYYEIVIEEFIADASQTEEHFITKAYFERLEKLIQEAPEHWLWSHRRWKYKRNAWLEREDVPEEIKRAV